MSEQPLFGDVLIKLKVATPGQIQEALQRQATTGERVGEALISLGYVTPEQIHEALSEALGLAPRRGPARPPLGELLIGLKFITTEQLANALEIQRSDGRRLGEILVALGLCTYRQIYEGLSVQQRMSGREGENQPAPKAGPTRVLVVDDSPLAVNVVSTGLTELGFEVHPFTDPFEALEQVYRLKPDIVLSDLEMPGLNGADLCRRLKTGPARAVPVVILTANDSDTERVDGLRSGADDYVAKSASMDELGARIEGIIRRTGETERVRKLFARYTSDAVVEEILKSGEVVLTGEKREVTVLFADIRNFTSMAESLAPEVVVEVLNGVLGKLSDAVLMCGGTLDKYLGDGLMAVFGAPVHREDDAIRALQAAKMMMSAMETLNAEAASSGRPKFELGIGINSGVVVAGNLGSAQRTEYTCIGDAVNVASRLCSVAEPGQIYVGERTRELVGVNAELLPLPSIRLKGKSQPVPLFRVGSRS